MKTISYNQNYDVLFYENKKRISQSLTHLEIHSLCLITPLYQHFFERVRYLNFSTFLTNRYEDSRQFSLSPYDFIQHFADMAYHIMDCQFIRHITSITNAFYNVPCLHSFNCGRRRRRRCCENCEMKTTRSKFEDAPKIFSAQFSISIGYGENNGFWQHSRIVSEKPCCS